MCSRSFILSMNNLTFYRRSQLSEMHQALDAWFTRTPDCPHLLKDRESLAEMEAAIPCSLFGEEAKVDEDAVSGELNNVVVDSETTDDHEPDEVAPSGFDSVQEADEEVDEGLKVNNEAVTVEATEVAPSGFDSVQEAEGEVEDEDREGDRQLHEAGDCIAGRGPGCARVETQRLKVKPISGRGGQCSMKLCFGTR